MKKNSSSATPPANLPAQVPEIDLDRDMRSEERRKVRKQIGITVGHNCFQLRKERHETQAQVAAAIGIDEKSYSNIERGIRLPRYDTLQALALHFGVTYNELLGDPCAPSTELSCCSSGENMGTPEDMIAAFSEVLNICSRFFRREPPSEQ